MELAESSTLTLSVGALAGLAAIIAAWVTLRMTVKQHAERFKTTDRLLDKVEDRLAKIERWRERVRGARAVAREDTDRIILGTAETGQAPRPSDD